MKRIVRLTESDLNRIVRRVLNEGRTGDQVYQQFEQRTTLQLDTYNLGKDKIVRGANKDQRIFFTYNCTTGILKKEKDQTKIYTNEDMIDIKEYCAVG